MLRTLPRNPIWLKISATRQFNPKSFNIHISKPFHAIFKKKLLASWKNMAFLVFFDIFRCFWVSFSISRAVSVCFWHCIWHLPTPDICLTHSDTIQTLSDTLRHHPDTPQKPPYLTCMRPLGERVIFFNFPDNCLTQTSARHAQILSRNCQTPSDTIQTPFKRPYFTVIWSYVISILLGPLVH